jgi:hypothetical protein
VSSRVGSPRAERKKVSFRQRALAPVHVVPEARPRQEAQRRWPGGRRQHEIRAVDAPHSLDARLLAGVHQDEAVAVRRPGHVPALALDAAVGQEVHRQRARVPFADEGRVVADDESLRVAAGRPPVGDQLEEAQRAEFESEAVVGWRRGPGPSAPHVVAAGQDVDDARPVRGELLVEFRQQVSGRAAGPAAVDDLGVCVARFERRVELRRIGVLPRSRAEPVGERVTDAEDAG